MVSYRTDDDGIAALESAADAAGISVSELIRDAVAAHINEKSPRRVVAVREVRLTALADQEMLASLARVGGLLAMALHRSELRTIHQELRGALATIEELADEWRIMV